MKKIEIKPLLISIGLVLIQTSFFFGIEFFQSTPHVIGNFIDDKIPFVIYSIIPYYIWYLMIFFIPYYLYKKDKTSLLKYIVSYLACIVIADIIFLVYPTTVIRPEVEIKGLFSFLTYMVYLVDNPPLNCFPSMHCAVSMLFILAVSSSKDISKRFKIIVDIISVTIMISTLLIKQHVFIDLVSGDIIMILCYIMFSSNKKMLNTVKKLLKL